MANWLDHLPFTFKLAGSILGKNFSIRLDICEVFLPLKSLKFKDVPHYSLLVEGNIMAVQVNKALEVPSNQVSK